MVRRLVRDSRGFAEAYGFPVTNNPASLFQLLYLSILLRPPGDTRRGPTVAQALRDHGWDSAARLARSLTEVRTAVLREAGRRSDATRLSIILGDLARTVVESYRGDLRRLRVAARYDPARERVLLKRLPGVDDEVVNLFLREAQVLWREVAPVADRRALVAARRLGLGRSTDDLAALAGGRDTERFAWLIGALARTDLEDRYADVRRAARG